MSGAVFDNVLSPVSIRCACPCLFRSYRIVHQSCCGFLRVSVYLDHLEELSLLFLIMSAPLSRLKMLLIGSLFSVSPLLRRTTRSLGFSMMALLCR